MFKMVIATPISLSCPDYSVLPAPSVNHRLGTKLLLSMLGVMGVLGLYNNNDINNNNNNNNNNNDNSFLYNDTSCTHERRY